MMQFFIIHGRCVDMKQRKEIAMPTIVLLFTILLWESVVRLFDISLYVLPAPSKILVSLYENREILCSHAMVTLSEACIGLAIAVVLAMGIAILMDMSSLFKHSVFPHLIVTQTVPVMILAPLFSIWLGFGLAPKILMVVFMCFFPIVISFSDGMAQVDIHQVNLLKSYQASRLQLYTMVKIPAAATNLFSGLKVAATYCIGGAIVGEWISSAAGLGYYMLRAKNGFMLDKVFACVVVIIALSLLLNGLVNVLEKIVCPHMRKK